MFNIMIETIIGAENLDFDVLKQDQFLFYDFPT